MKITDLWKTYTAAHEDLSTLPSSDQKGLEAASAKIITAVDAMIETRSESIPDLSAKLAFIEAEHENENYSTVRRGLNSLRADLNQLCA